MGENKNQEQNKGTPNDLAQTAFDQRNLWYEKHNEIMVNSGILVVRSSLILNGGACLALLAFLANIWDAQPNPETTIPLQQLILQNLAIFAWGALLAVAGTGISYLVNLFRMEESRAQTMHWDDPYIRDTTASKRWGTAGNILQWVSIVVVAASPALFLTGLLRLTQQLS